MEELRKWLGTPDADRVVDDAAEGFLTMAEVQEIAEDFEVSVQEVGRAINVLLNSKT